MANIGVANIGVANDTYIVTTSTKSYLSKFIIVHNADYVPMCGCRNKIVHFNLNSYYNIYNDPLINVSGLEFGTSSMMFHAMENESGNTSEEEINNLFDPKIFIESLFKTRDAEIELILNTTTTTTTTANFTKLLNSDTTNNDKDIDHQNADHLDYTLDVYLLIGAVSFVIFVILSVAMCKAITMLKISLQDGADDTVPVPAEQLQNQQRAMGPEMVTQSVASGYLLNGKWNCNVG